jgi:asparagine synthase (glutamine-hydrolysing)
LSRLYPYLARSPVAQQALARQFFGRNLAGWREPGFAHATRWQTAGALTRLFSPALKDALAGRDVVRDFLATLPADFCRWSYLAQDQYIEVRTLLSGYLLSSQGDRMLMANSVEGRFPFLDRHVVEFANALPAAYKLRGLAEKYVLKRASADVVPAAILDRKKQPYRAPDALSFVGDGAPAYVAELLSEKALADAGVFDAKVASQLYAKCRSRGDAGQFSNTDNMALVGVLSTQLLHHHFVAPGSLERGPSVPLRVHDHAPEASSR